MSYSYKKVKKKEVDAEITVNGNVITGRHSRRFTNHLDENIILFGNGDDYEFDFYDSIKDIEIRKLPDRIEFNIINIFNDRVENPIQLLVYPFNEIGFLKIDNVFYVQFSYYTDEDEWNMKWAVEYYFLEFEKVVYDFPTARIREDNYYSLYEGRLKLEIEDTESTTIDIAFKKALPTINSIIESVEKSLDNRRHILAIIEKWKKNKDNEKEEFWQKLFIDYPEIISQSFSFPIVLFQDKAYLGGKSLENKSGKIIDYAFRNNSTNNIALIEIKTPQTKLIGSEYRSTYSMSHDLTGSVNQLLKYRDTVLKDYYSLNYNSHKSFLANNPKCLLIIGSFDNLSAEERETFEIYRNDLKTIDIVTFDELFDKMYILFKLIQA